MVQRLLTERGTDVCANGGARRPKIRALGRLPALATVRTESEPDFDEPIQIAGTVSAAAIAAICGALDVAPATPPSRSIE